jgi:hypothetical protein
MGHKKLISVAIGAGAWLIATALNILHGPPVARAHADPLPVVRPGQKITFHIEASDPNGDDLDVRVICGGSSGDEDVEFDYDGPITWTVREENIGDSSLLPYLHREPAQLPPKQHVGRRRQLPISDLAASMNASTV